MNSNVVKYGFNVQLQKQHDAVWAHKITSTVKSAICTGYSLTTCGGAVWDNFMCII